MIPQFKLFILGFLNRNGIHVLFATVSARILSFFASWIALKLIPNFELGLIIYAINIISLIIPLSGLGASQGLLRYGALLATREEKNKLFIYVLKKGGTLSIILVVVTILLSSFLSQNLTGSKSYLIVVSITIFTLFLLESLKIQFRVLHKNKLFASTEILYNILLVIMVFFGSFFFKEYGYIAALILAPLVTFLIYLPKIKLDFNVSKPFNVPDFSFWKYSFYTGLSNVATQLLLVLDIILIGTIIKNPEMVTIYKYVSLIPFSLLFLPRVILITDFVTLTENFTDKDYIKKYIKNYISLFLVISFFILTISFFLNEQILLFFGKEFVLYSTTFLVLIFGIIGILLFRGLFGNLLSAMGKAYVNYWISVIAIIINLISNYILIPRFGILGAAITSTIIMWLTSILSVMFFYYFLKRI